MLKQHVLKNDICSKQHMLETTYVQNNICSKQHKLNKMC